MEFLKVTDRIFKDLPEFKLEYKEDLEEGYYNSFLGDFGLFVRDGIVNRKAYALKSIKLINDLFNNNYKNKDFENKMIVNVLEVLTDYQITQKTSVEHFEGQCLIVFKGLLKSSFFTDLLDPR